MTSNDDNRDIILVGIDVAKRKHDVLIQWPNGRRKAVKIESSSTGFKQLLSILNKNSKEYIIRCAIEPTADYHRTIAYWLGQQGIEIHLASSLSCARAREMLYQTWDKNDRKDTRVILYMLEQGLTEPFFDPLVKNNMDLQELCNTYQQISLARSRCLHSLINHCFTLYFPEVERYYQNSRSEWLCKLLLKFPTPNTILRYKKATFVKRAWKIVGRKHNKQVFLEELYELAEQSIGLPVALDGASVQMYKLQLARFLELTEKRCWLEKLAENQLEDREDYKHLRTIPGIGPILAMIILAESGELTRFSHYRQYLNFCGFNLSGIQSGLKKGAYKLSKRGNARLRYAYWLAANSAIRHRENSFKHKYNHYIRCDPENADLKRKGRVAVAIKIARVAHALVKSRQDYRGYYEFGYGT